MRIKETKTITTEVLVDVQCDVCGKSCKKADNHFFNYRETEYEFATLDADWGYYSDSDGKSWRIDLCEDCFYDTLAHLKLRCTTDDKALNGKETNDK